MRVNPNPYPDLIAEAALTQQQINTDEEEIASGKSVNVPSDNPAAAASLIVNADQTSQADNFQRSIGSVQGELQTADSALGSTVTAIQQAIDLGVEAANGTLNAADRASILTQVQGIQAQLVSLANSNYQSNYVFGGTASQIAPYVLDGSSTSGVTYQGNTDVNSVTLGSDFSVQTNLPGSQIFSGSGGNVFQSIQDLIVGLQSNTGITTAVTELGSALNYVGSQRVFYDNGLNQLNSQTTFLSSETTQLAQQQNTEGGADTTAVISNLTTEQTALQATLQSVALTENTNLFQYLK